MLSTPRGKEIGADAATVFHPRARESTMDCFAETSNRK
jgi:hypothetical protein